MTEAVVLVGVISWWKSLAALVTPMEVSAGGITLAGPDLAGSAEPVRNREAASCLDSAVVVVDNVADYGASASGGIKQGEAEQRLRAGKRDIRGCVVRAGVDAVADGPRCVVADEHRAVSNVGRGHHEVKAAADECGARETDGNVGVVQTIPELGDLHSHVFPGARWRGVVGNA